MREGVVSMTMIPVQCTGYPASHDNTSPSCELTGYGKSMRSKSNPVNTDRLPNYKGGLPPQRGTIDTHGLPNKSSWLKSNCIGIPVLSTCPYVLEKRRGTGKE